MATLHTYRTRNGTETKKINALQAIRRQCLECVCWDVNEVRLCQSPLCSLYPFRFGRDPGNKRVISEEHREILSIRMQQLAVKKKNPDQITGENCQG